MDKRQRHYLATKLRPVKPVYFLGAFLITGATCVLALRSNNQTMIKLRSNVYSADQKDQNVAGALQSLRSYVYSHMNTDLASGPNAVYPPIQLKYTYNRLAQAQAQQIYNTNSVVYTAAQAYCQQQNSVSFSGRTRVPCIEAYVQQHGVSASPIPVGLYEFDFISPSWSPDLAGWSLLATIASSVLFVCDFILQRWLRRASVH